MNRGKTIGEGTTVYARIAGTLVVSIIAAIIALSSLAVNIYQYRYNRYGVQAAKEMKCSYKKNGSTNASGTIKPSKGTLEFGYCQTKGSNKCRYTFYCKKNTEAKYKVIKKSFGAPQNNVHYGTFKIVKGNGRTIYNFKNVKVAGLSKASTLVLDVAIV